MTDKNALLTTVENNLGTTLAAKAAALPDGFQMAKFQQNCMVMLKGIEAEKLAKIPPQDIVECLMKGALLDLDFATGECYAIPYGKELNFQTDYKGEEKVARTYSIKPIYNVIKDVIREGDEYKKIIEDGNVKFIFKPLPLNNNKIIGAFAQIIFTDGSSIGDDASVAELETIRKQFSKAANSPAWTKTTGEMYKKVILRRVLKNVSKSFKNSAQSIAYATATDFEFNNKTGVSTEAEKIVNVFENKLPVNNQQAITTNVQFQTVEMPKAQIVHWGIPDYDSRIDTGKQTPYTAPCDGLFVYSNNSTDSYMGSASVNGFLVSTLRAYTTDCFPVAKNDVISLANTPQIITTYFVPMKGEINTNV